MAFEMILARDIGMLQAVTPVMEIGQGISDTGFRTGERGAIQELIWPMSRVPTLVRQQTRKNREVDSTALQIGWMEPTGYF